MNITLSDNTEALAQHKAMMQRFEAALFKMNAEIQEHLALSPSQITMANVHALEELTTQIENLYSN